jgi:antitoxin component YwqK of YwqJK toxin-antitoxin module
MKNTIILLILIAFMSNVNAQEITREYYENGQLKSVGKYTRGDKIGEWKWYYENGQLKTIAKYGDVGGPYNERIGEAKNYYENGQLSRYYNHLSNGKTLDKGYYRNGQLKSIGYSSSFRKVGEWKYYYYNGQLRQVINHLLEGSLTRERKLFYENGVLKEHSNWSKGYEVGKTKFYYPNGQLSKIGQVYRKSPAHRLDDSSDIPSKLKIGEWKYYYENGQLSEVGNYSEDKKETYHFRTIRSGKWKAYYENGKMKSVGDWQTGKWLWYEENGKSNSTSNLVPLSPESSDYICIFMQGTFNHNPAATLKKTLIRKKLISSDATKEEIGSFINYNFDNLKCLRSNIDSSKKEQHLYQRANDAGFLNFFYDVILEDEYYINLNNKFYDNISQTNITLLDFFNYILDSPHELRRTDETTISDLRDGIIEMGGKTTKELEGN